MLSRNIGKISVVNDKVAVLSSGGLDSAVMLAQLARSYQQVHPVYVRCGLFWEEAELECLHKFLSVFNDPAIQEARELDLKMDDVYGEGWYSCGSNVPGYNEADEQWMIPGRNVILTSKTAVWCKAKRVHAIAHGTLSGNPFADATPEFFASMELALSQGLGEPIRILTPLIQLRKPEVILLGKDLPLQLTLSCPRPVGGSHCGVCGKCRERIVAFGEAKVEDPTQYHQKLRRESSGLRA